MPRTLIRKDPSSFKTLQLFVEASPEGLSYQGLGMPLNFSQMLEKRKPVVVVDSQRFAVELANLGVSVRLQPSNGVLELSAGRPFLDDATLCAHDRARRAEDPQFVQLGERGLGLVVCGRVQGPR